MENNDPIILKPVQNLWRDHAYKRAIQLTGDPIFAGLFTAQLYKESTFNPASYNKNSEARGIAQFTPIAIEELGGFDPHNPKVAIDKAIEYNMSNLRRFNNNYALAFAAYNMGPTAVSRRISSGALAAPKETKNYVRALRNINNKFVVQYGAGARLPNADDFDLLRNLNKSYTPTVTFGSVVEDTEPDEAQALSVPSVEEVPIVSSPVSPAPQAELDNSAAIMQKLLPIAPGTPVGGSGLGGGPNDFPLEGASGGFDPTAGVQELLSPLLGGQQLEPSRSDDVKKTESDVRDFVSRLLEAHLG